MRKLAMPASRARRVERLDVVRPGRSGEVQRHAVTPLAQPRRRLDDDVGHLGAHVDEAERGEVHGAGERPVVEAEPGARVAAHLLGHGTVRSALVGEGQQPRRRRRSRPRSAGPRSGVCMTSMRARRATSQKPGVLQQAHVVDLLVQRRVEARASRCRAASPARTPPRPRSAMYSSTRRVSCETTTDVDALEHLEERQVEVAVAHHGHEHVVGAAPRDDVVDAAGGDPHAVRRRCRRRPRPRSCRP